MENNYIVAIDLGSSNVVVAVGVTAPDGKVEIVDIVVGESAGVAGGEVKNVELASASVRKALEEIDRRHGWRVAQACVGISGNHIQCAKHPYYVIVAGRDGEIAAEDVRRLNESMRNLQAPAGYTLMHTVPQHYIVNDDEEVKNPVGHFGKTLGSTFNLIIGDNTIIQRLEKAMQKSGVHVSGLLINPLAMAEAVTYPDEKDMGVAVVDIGAGTTDVCIYQDGLVRSVCVIPIGADAVNRDIRSFGIMERYVEDLKTMYGCAVAELVDSDKLVKIPGRTGSDYKDISFRNLATIIEARMTDIVDYVMEEIREAGCEGKLGAGIVLTGGSAALPEIGTLFERRTGLEVRLATPTIHVAPESKDKVKDPRLSVAVGMLWQMLYGGEANARADAEHAQQAWGGGVVAGAGAGAPQTVYDQIVAGQSPAVGEADYEDDGAGARKRKKKEKAPKPSRRAAKADYDDTSAGDDDGWVDEPARAKGEGVFGKLKKAFTRVVDLDVLDDEDTGAEINDRRK
ncbi:MAG: cell division protein FtsA [Rikenellaceae bacterium]|nr:cell division protein FtsA [Rikenellaceae bacterium]MCL2693071.1 cell division protein FtsA [Rikenellaceae bacterium]